MSYVYIAKSPDLSFLRMSPNGNFKYPFILNSDKTFNWDANRYLMHFAGSAVNYGIKPQPDTVVDQAYSIGIFHEFLNNKNTSIYSMNDEGLFDLVDYLKSRKIDNGTIKRHFRIAIAYLIHIQKINPELFLVTETEEDASKYSIHVVKEFMKKGNRTIHFFNHPSISSLTTIEVEVEYIRDDEFLDWLDAIHDTSIHPTPSEFIVSRWEVISYLLDGTGSRISEISKLTRSMIKNSYKPLVSADENVILYEVPINKGKYKGKTRNIPIPNGTLQLIMSHIEEIEEKWPELNHDYLFVNAETGQPLSGAYLKNYTLSVIKHSSFAQSLAHVNNHSFRHRFITLNIAKTLEKFNLGGTFSNILTVAATAVRKLTLHASNETLSRYVHLAQDYNRRKSIEETHVSTPLKMKILELKRIMNSYQNNEFKPDETLNKIDQIINKL